jgi:pantoate--beta-alanine ligase
MVGEGVKPVILDTLEKLRDEVASRPGGMSVGFVPTMGWLHEGHLSLVRRARRENDRVIVSIFVNPTQFGPNEDLSSYPRDLSRDAALLADVGADDVFFPTPDMMYPAGYRTVVKVEDLSDLLCGKSRPTHFQGVATVVTKLVSLVRPDRMYMGEKDFQQVVILERMLADLNFSTRIVRCPLVRESDGLAMSSRNLYLSPEERQRALCLHEALQLAAADFIAGARDPGPVIDRMREHIQTRGGDIDYVELVDPITLTPAKILAEDTRAVLAVRIGKTRLIDNRRLG